MMAKARPCMGQGETTLMTTPCSYLSNISGQHLHKMGNWLQKKKSKQCGCTYFKNVPATFKWKCHFLKPRDSSSSNILHRRVRKSLPWSSTCSYEEKKNETEKGNGAKMFPFVGHAGHGKLASNANCFTLLHTSVSPGCDRLWIISSRTSTSSPSTSIFT